MPRLRVIDDEAIERPFNKEQFKRLLTFLKPYKGRIAFALCLMVISAVCSLALPMLMSKAIDQIDAGNAHNFPFFLIAMVICAAVGSICVRYRARIMDTAGRSAIADMRQTLFDHIQDLSFNFFDSRSAGKIMVRVINDVNSLNDLFTNGIVNVSAKDMGTGKEQSIKITASSGLSEDDIQRLVREAEAHAGEDKKKQEVIEARNHADSLIYGTEKSLADLGDKADAAVKSDIEAKIAELRKIMEGEDAEAIKAATDALAKASHKLAEQLYQQQAQQTGGQPGGAQQEAGAHQDGNNGGNGGDDVVDADYTEVKK